MAVQVIQFNKVKVDGLTAGSLEAVWDNYPETRPPTSTELTDSALAYMETALTNGWWDLGEAELHRDRFNALGGGGIVSVPQYILDMFPSANPPPE